MKKVNLKIDILIKYYVIIVFAIYVFISLIKIDTSWDYLSYHLPFALRKFGITTFVPDDFLLAFEAGHPKLGHFLQGIPVYLTGYFPFASSLGLASVLLFFFFIKKSFPQVNIFLLGLLCLSIPLIQAHLPIGYLDLTQGCFLAIAVLSLKKYEKDIITGKNYFTLALVSLGLAANIKFQGWIPAGFFSLYSVFLIIRDKLWTKKTILLFLFISFLMQVFTPVSNYIKFGNPSYPFETSVFKNKNMANFNYIETEAKENQIPKVFTSTNRNVLFYISMFEIDRILYPDFKFRYWYDMARPEKVDSPHFRMGGFGTIGFYLLIAIILIYGPRKYLFLVLLSSLVISFIPHSNEMRYWLFIPLTLAALSAITTPKLHYSIVLLLIAFSTHIFIYTRPWKGVMTQNTFWENKLIKPEICSKDSYFVIKSDYIPSALLHSGKYFNECLIKNERRPIKAN